MAFAEGVDELCPIHSHEGHDITDKAANPVTHDKRTAGYNTSSTSSPPTRDISATATSLETNIGQSDLFLEHEMTS